MHHKVLYCIRKINSFATEGEKAISVRSSPTASSSAFPAINVRNEDKCRFVPIRLSPAIWCRLYRWAEKADRAWWIGSGHITRKSKQTKRKQTSSNLRILFIFSLYIEAKQKREGVCKQTTRVRVLAAMPLNYLSASGGTKQSSSTCRLDSFAGLQVRVRGLASDFVFLARLGKLNSNK